MVAVSDIDSSSSVDAVVTQAPFPFWLATVEITGEAVVSADGYLLGGAILFTPSKPVYVPGWTVIEGSASLNVQAGVAVPMRIPCTDCIPGTTFTYTITQILSSPDGVSPPPIEGVSLPSSLRPSVDVSQLL